MTVNHLAIAVDGIGFPHLTLATEGFIWISELVQLRGVKLLIEMLPQLSFQVSVEPKINLEL